MSNLPTKNNVCARYIEQALKEHAAAVQAFRNCKERVLKCGFFFREAQANCNHGDFGAVLLKYEDQISKSSVYKYIDFANEVEAWVKAENPKLEGMQHILAAGIKMVLQSPKGYIALFRQLGEMRKFGEYDEVKYRAKKMLGESKQLSFSFELLASEFSRYAENDFTVTVPEGKDEAEAYEELACKLEATAAKLRAKAAKPIEV